MPLRAASNHGVALSLQSRTMREFRGRVRLPASNSQFDGHIPYISLNKLGQRLHLRQLGRRGAWERPPFADFGESISAAPVQALLPIAHLFQFWNPLVVPPPVAQMQLPGLRDPPPWRIRPRAWFLNALTTHCTYFPPVPAWLLVVYPRSFVFQLGEAAGVMGFSDGIRSWKYQTSCRTNGCSLFILIATIFPGPAAGMRRVCLLTSIQLAPSIFGREISMLPYPLLHSPCPASDTPAAHARDLERELKDAPTVPYSRPPGRRFECSRTVVLILSRIEPWRFARSKAALRLFSIVSRQRRITSGASMPARLLRRIYRSGRQPRHNMWDGSEYARHLITRRRCAGCRTTCCSSPVRTIWKKFRSVG